MNLKAAILGTQQTGDGARDVLRQAGMEAFQRMGGYVAGKTPCTNTSEPVTFRLHPEIEFARFGNVSAGLQFTYMVTYPNVIVWHDSVVMCWDDTANPDYDLRQLEITRNALIEMWSERRVEMKRATYGTRVLDSHAP